MPFKICFNNEIHRFAKLPTDLKALNDFVLSTFQNQLPKAWSVQYTDSDGDNIVISHNQDYLEVIQSESKNPSATIKFYIVAKEGFANSTKQEELKINNDEPSAQNIIHHTNQDISSVPKIEDTLPLSQNKWEETAQADNLVITDPLQQQKQFEDQPRACPQPLDEGVQTQQDMRQAKSLLKQLFMFEISENEKIGVLEKLKKIEENLTSEQKEKLEKKREYFEKRAAKKQAKTQKSFIKDQPNVDENGSPIHHHITCANCKVTPIIGVRYKCSICRGFDLCENCEGTVDHVHPFLKLKDATKIWKRNIKKQEKKEKPFKIFRAFKMLENMTEAMNKGKTEKIKKCYERTLIKVPSEAKQILEPVLKAMIEGSIETENLRNMVSETKEKLLDCYHPQDKEKFVEEWQQLLKKKQERRQLKEQSRKTKEGSNSTEEDAKKREKRPFKKFSKQVREKALKMREVLPSVKMGKLFEFVAQSSEELSVEELIAQYRS